MRIFLRLSILTLLISAASCKKEVTIKNVKPPVVEAESEFTGKINGADYKLSQNSITSTYYTTTGDPIKSLLIGTDLDAKGTSFTIFIGDFKEGDISITKKRGTSLNPGNPQVKVNAVAAPPAVQTYLRFMSNGNAYYASSGSINVSINNDIATLSWTVGFKNAAGKDFSSTGSLKLLSFTANPSPNTNITDPTPVAALPIIESISPGTGKAGDTLRIAGVNFGTAITDNVVKVNGAITRVFSATATKLVVILPQTFSSGNVTVQVKYGEVVKGPIFLLGYPNFQLVSPNVGREGDTVTIYANSLSPLITDNVVVFNGKKAVVISQDGSSILKVRVPAGVVTGNVTLTVKEFPAKDQRLFTVNAPYPAIKWDEVYSSSTLQKTNLMASAGKSLLFTGGLTPGYLYYSADGLQYTNVYNKLPFNKNKELEIHLIIADGNTYYLSSNLGVARSTNGTDWTKLTPSATDADKPFTGVVAFNSKVYLLSGNVFYTSLDAGKTWTEKAANVPQQLDYLTNYFNSDKYIFAIDTKDNAPGHNSAVLYQTNPGPTGPGAFWSATSNQYNTGVYHFKEGYQDFMKTSSYCQFGAFSPINAPSIENQKLYRSDDQARSWQKVGDEVCYVVKTNKEQIAYGSRSFNLSTNEGVTFKSYPIPTGYVLGGIEITDGYYYINCTDPSGASKIFRSIR